MAIKIPVLDRVSKYPGRVKLTPVSGSSNLYDMERADEPTTSGTPINKALFDNKAYTLTDNVTVYVATTGSDTTGDGSVSKPFKTIQKAVDSIPLHLGGYTATIDIANGTYNERVAIQGFTSGTLAVGVSGRTITVRGFAINQSSLVELRTSNITYASGYPGPLIFVGKNSSVVQMSQVTINGSNSTEVGIGVAYDGNYTVNGANVIVNNCKGTAIKAVLGSKAAFYNIQGSGNTDYGLMAEQGGLLTYNTSTLTATLGNVARIGGRILAGSAVAPSSIE